MSSRTGTSFTRSHKAAGSPFPGGPALAPWELLPRHALVTITDNHALQRVAETLRTASPGYYHTNYGTTKMGVAAIQWLPAGLSVDAFVSAVLQEGSTQGARFMWLSSPGSSADQREQLYLFEIREKLKYAQGGGAPQLADIGTRDVENFAAVGLMDDTPPRCQVRGLEQVGVQASALESSREEPADYSPVQQVDAKGGSLPMYR